MSRINVDHDALRSLKSPSGVLLRASIGDRVLSTLEVNLSPAGQTNRGVNNLVSRSFFARDLREVPP